ncbi:hypothetical protein [Daejeonella sp.]|uniref:hypothetical protein n=1 Tax=Daejeonella sp. TaxID=2805397 RepID=UPI0030BEFEA4
MAQSPVSPNNTASSRITIRIPSFATITLADNNSKSISYNSPANSKKAELSQSKSMGEVISNRKWSVNVSREESSPNTFFTSNILSKIKDAPSKEPSVTMIYVTSMN